MTTSGRAMLPSQAASPADHSAATVAARPAAVSSQAREVSPGGAGLSQAGRSRRTSLAAFRRALGLSLVQPLAEVILVACEREDED